MYGCFVVPPDDDAAALGVLFWHKDGFSTACGHGTIALGTWAVETGIVPVASPGPTDVVVDVPSGRVTARVHTEAGRVRSVDFVSVPSWSVVEDLPVDTTLGDVRVDVGFGGAFYAHLDVTSVGLTVAPGDLPSLIALGREVKGALDATRWARHPHDSRLDGIYGTILFEGLGTTPSGELHQRNVTVFADGEVDRSPCGSGTASRVAVLHRQGRLDAGQVLIHDSIVGSRFTAVVEDAVTQHGLEAVVPVIRGRAFRTGEHAFVVDPDDDLVPGFVLR
jgi:proline racemase/trans-L-3-hydroxyproline dehydratase